ncbi:MAG: hypothetical protein K6G22_13930 [Lachnospiraceae bacterium]|nr:hypothetical protein [Lachnospiraceae bacterium]
MAAGDRAPDGSYVTGTENGCTWRSDGHLYNQYGYQVETDAEKAERYEREQAIRQANASQKYAGGGYQDPSQSYGQIFEDGLQDMGRGIADSVHETNRQFARGFAGLTGIAALIAFFSTYRSETRKNPYDTAGATSKALRNTLCVLGIIAVIALLCIATFVVVFVLGEAAGNVGAAVLILLNLIGCITIFGLIRVMLNKTFFLRLRRNDGERAYVEPLPKIVYILTGIVTAALVNKPVYKAIENRIMENDPSLLDIKTWQAGRYFEEIGIKISAASLGISILAGILACLIVGWIHKRR